MSSSKKNRNKWTNPIFWAAIAAIASAIVAVVGDKGILDLILPQGKTIQCNLSSFNTKNYKEAEEAFFQDFDRGEQPHPFSLWKQNGAPRPLGEILVSQSQELSSLREAIAGSRVLYPQNKLILISASAGAGKSAVAHYLADVGNSVALIDLSQLRYNSDENKINPMTQLMTDLEIGDVEVSKMADLRPEEKAKGFIPLLTKIAGKDVKNKTSIIIDGLDEVHPYSSTHILGLARQYIDKKPQQNIIFFGRGEAFRGYIDKYKDNAIHEAIYIKPLYLNEPELLRWYIAEFLAYPYLEKEPDYIPNPKEVDEKFRQVSNLVNQNPELRHFLQTTEPANILLRNLRYGNDSPQKVSELEFLDFIKRNRKTHNRPSPEKSEAWSLYEKALIQATRRLNPEKRPDGTFTAIVKPSERINVLYEDQCLSVELSQVLNRSGVVSLNPFNQNQLEYTFQPITIQKFIAEQESLSGTQ
jgi:hypothetical protein